MTVSDPTNEWYTTRQQSAVTARPRRGVVLHHGATTSMDAIIQMETTGSRQVSSNRVVKDSRCARVVSDDPNIRAWSLSSAYWDSVLSSVECANESTDGWTISPASHETLARYTAYRAQTEGWWPHRSGDPTTWTVYGHREIYIYFGASYATACPGGMDLDWITTRAQQLLNPTTLKGNSSMPAMIATPKTGGGFRFILTDGIRKVAVTEDQTLANNWTFALCGGVLPVATNTGTAQEQAMKLAAFKWLDAQPISPAPGTPDVDEELLAKELAKVLPTATKDDLAAAVTAITKAIPTKITGTLGN